MNPARIVRNTGRAVIGLPLFAGQHALRQRYLDRHAADVVEFSEPAPDIEVRRTSAPQSLADQPPTAGCGPLVSRAYSVDIAAASLTAEQLLSRFSIRPEDFVPRHVSGFFVDDQPATDLEVGEEVVVEIPGPWNGPVRIVETTDTSLLLATLEGHMEAGSIRFRVGRRDGGLLRFEIRSWARAGDEYFEQLHVTVKVAQEAQLAMWVHTCDRAVAISGGRRAGPIQAMTETLKGSEVEC